MTSLLPRHVKVLGVLKYSRGKAVGDTIQLFELLSISVSLCISVL